MKAILEFKIPEEETEFYHASNGGRFANALSDLDNWLRNKLKYESDALSEKEIEAYNSVRQELLGLLDGLELDR